MEPLTVRSGLTISESNLEWSSVRSSGPGGQNVNKVATKVVLRFDFESCPSLSRWVKERLRTRYARRLDAQGRLVVTSQVARDRARNLEDARVRLARIVTEALSVPKPRKKTKPTRASAERRLAEKRRVGTRKRNRAQPVDDA